MLEALENQMSAVAELIGYDPDQPHPAPDVEHRQDMSPEHALWDCYDSWAGGAWSEEEAQTHLEEVEVHLHRLGRTSMWNVVSTVVEIVEAVTATQAQQSLERRLRKSGFEVFEDSAGQPLPAETQ